MNEPRMSTTLPSPVDRGGFRFVALDASGTVWRWVDEDMVWVRERPDRSAAASTRRRSGICTPRSAS